MKILQIINIVPLNHLHLPHPVKSTLASSRVRIYHSRLIKERTFVWHTARFELHPLRFAGQPQQYPVVPCTIPPILNHKISTLCENLRLRPPGAAQSRVIAVDGFDTRAVWTIMGYLYEHIRQCLNVPVRPFSPVSHFLPQESSWFAYLGYMEYWHRLWNFLINMPFPLGTFATGSLDRGTQLFANEFCVNIVPYSPLMIASRMEAAIESENVEMELRAWRSLVSEWRGKIQPDITISVMENICGPGDLGVSAFSSHHMLSLMVSKAPWSANAISGVSKRQLRRISLEVLEWLVED